MIFLTKSVVYVIISAQKRGNIMTYKQAKERDLKRKETLKRIRKYCMDFKLDFNIALDELFNEGKQILTYENRKM